MNNDFNVTSFDHFQPYNSYWGNYDSMIKEMSNDQKNFVGKQDEVKNAKNLLISAFIDYLFEQNKNNFVSTSEIAKKLADDYINTVKNALNNYETRSERLEKENADLRKQIQQLLDFGEKTNGKKQDSTK